MDADDVEFAFRLGPGALCNLESGEAGVGSERDGLQNVASNQLAADWNSLLVERRPRHRGAARRSTTAGASADYVDRDDCWGGIMPVLRGRGCLLASIRGR